MQRNIIPDIVQPTDVACATLDETIGHAAAAMRERKIAALVINDSDGKLSGIVTERDIVFRAVAVGMDPTTAKISDIMTPNPDTLAPGDSAADALELMQTRGYRHLPVVLDGKCIAIVSIRDLFKSVKESLEDSIRETEAFVFGDRYGA
tara:strand:+ start:51098 stop:51544 length:447 start_codon:yes stop_codon:yes gene_type:complete